MFDGKFLSPACSPLQHSSTAPPATHCTTGASRSARKRESINHWANGKVMFRTDSKGDSLLKAADVPAMKNKSTQEFEKISPLT